MAVEADAVVVELQAKTADYNRKMGEAATAFERSMGRQESSAKASEAAVAAAAANKAKAELSSAKAALEASKQRQVAAQREVTAANAALSAANKQRGQSAAKILAARNEARARLDAANASVAANEKEIASNQKAVQSAQRAADQKIAAARRATDAAEREQRQQDALRIRATGSIGGGAVSAVGRFAAPLIGGYAGIAGAREYLELADAYKSIQAQLKLATAESGNFGIAQEDVARIARETRSGLAETAGLYGAFNRAAMELGRTQAEGARATETFSKAMIVGGASAQDAANGTRQFLQALAGGILRAEEFNSVVEASPRVARLFAEGLNTNIGGLRKLVNEGKVTADQLFAILNRPDLFEGINREFAELPVTFDQAMTLVRNSAIETFGAFDRGGQFSTALANFVTQGANGFSDLAQSAEREGINIRAAFEGLNDVFTPLINHARFAFSSIREESNYTRDTIASILSAYDAVTNIPRRLGNEIVDRLNGSLGTSLVRNPLSDARGVFLGRYNNSSNDLATNARGQRLGARFGINASDIAAGNYSGIRQSTAPRARSGGVASAARAARGGASRRAIASGDNDVQKLLVDISRRQDDLLDSLNNPRRPDVQKVLGRAGVDYQDIGDIVAEYDRQAQIEGRAREEMLDRLYRKQENDIYALSSIYERAFDGGVSGIWDTFKQEGIRAVALVLAQLTLGKSLGDALGGATASIFGGLFGGREGGGNVRAGQPYIVGEKRAEIFIPPQSGKIIPRIDGPGGGGRVVNVYQTHVFDARGGITTPQLIDQFNRVSTARAQEAGRAAYEASPQRSAKLQSYGN